jgi:hypothetical protein
MTIKSLFSLIRLLLLISSTLGAESPTTPAEVQSAAAFARLKSLAGTWQSIGPKGEHAKLQYEIISGGSAVMERFSSDALPRNSGEMITVYYIDRGELVLTHYCIAGNQPHLRATLYDAKTGELNFEFVAADNMPSGEEGHMHSAKMRFIDDKHLSTEWQYMEGRSPKFKEVVQFTRTN